MKLSSYIYLLLVFFIASCTNETLPIVSKYIADDGKEQVYTIDSLSFITQNKTKTSAKTTQDKVYIANFFFTRCPSICPPMTKKIKELTSLYATENFMALSISIDPKHDTPDVLHEYANRLDANLGNWLFLWGTDKNLYHTAQLFRTSFNPINENEDNFYHSSYVALVGKKRYIRGFYDLLKDGDFTKLKKDIALLVSE